jgi:TATA-box binding protein (TBP) (component of TFIID and TFIIIB)
MIQGEPEKLIYPTIENIVAFAQIANQDNMNLNFIAESMIGTSYNKNRFPGLIIRKLKPKCTIILFKSGKMIIIWPKI